MKKLRDSKSPPGCDVLEGELQSAIGIFNSLSWKVRPPDDSFGPGGLVRLLPNLPTLIIPDLHGRRGFFYQALTMPLFQGGSFLELLYEKKGSVVCVGDAFHGESPVRERWNEAYDEFLTGFKKRKAMNHEMADNLGLLQMILTLMQLFPENFFFLKGNHENIDNEFGRGNYPFRKFVNEGEMVKLWTQRFLGDNCLQLLKQYENLLPLAAEGDGFLVTHAEPAQGFSRDKIINAYRNDDVLYGLTWTDNGEAQSGSVAETLASFFPGRDRSICFGGHRPVNGYFSLRNGDRYIQINHPVAELVALVRRGEDFNPAEQIVRIDTVNGGRRR
ncbi:metallophosphoesterase [Marispirochaeta sp.]|uniref:metallophosphoesterase n=1 Tax=Marispirochaeta sp. TaxID=2038653 RepID=UPI0029C7DFB8|nr:metallophosphoesterase [Marispirochaeta sp.]